MTEAIFTQNYKKMYSFFKKKVEKDRFWTEIEDKGCGIALSRAGHPSKCYQDGTPFCQSSLRLLLLDLPDKRRRAA